MCVNPLTAYRQFVASSKAATKDNTPHHFSLFCALLENWDGEGSLIEFTVRGLHKDCFIGNRGTFARCLKELAAWKGIEIIQEGTNGLDNWKVKFSGSLLYHLCTTSVPPLVQNRTTAEPPLNHQRTTAEPVPFLPSRTHERGGAEKESLVITTPPSFLTESYSVTEAGVVEGGAGGIAPNEPYLLVAGAALTESALRHLSKTNRLLREPMEKACKNYQLPFDESVGEFFRRKQGKKPFNDLQHLAIQFGYVTGDIDRDLTTGRFRFPDPNAKRRELPKPAASPNQSKTYAELMAEAQLATAR